MAYSQPLIQASVPEKVAPTHGGGEADTEAQVGGNNYGPLKVEVAE